MPKSMSECGRAGIPVCRPTLRVLYGEAGEVRDAAWVGIRQCGCSLCPNCMARRSVSVALEVSRYAVAHWGQEYAVASGPALALLTLTAPSRPYDTEERMTAWVRAAWDRVREGRGGLLRPDGLAGELGDGPRVVGWVAATEGTWSKKSGPHPHYHVLIALDRHLDGWDVSDLDNGDRVWARWAKAVHQLDRMAAGKWAPRDPATVDAPTGGGPRCVVQLRADEAGELCADEGAALDEPAACAPPGPSWWWRDLRCKVAGSCDGGAVVGGPGCDEGGPGCVVQPRADEAGELSPDVERGCSGAAPSSGSPWVRCATPHGTRCDRTPDAEIRALWRTAHETPTARLCWRIWRAWSSALTATAPEWAEGREPAYWSQDLTVCTSLRGLEGYLCKLGFELAQGSRKVGRAGSWTPLDLLARACDVSEREDADEVDRDEAAHRWRSWLRAFQGKHLMSWSRGTQDLRKIYEHAPKVSLRALPLALQLAGGVEVERDEEGDDVDDVADVPHWAYAELVEALVDPLTLHPTTEEADEALGRELRLAESHAHGHEDGARWCDHEAARLAGELPPVHLPAATPDEAARVLGEASEARRAAGVPELVSEAERLRGLAAACRAHARELRARLAITGDEAFTLHAVNGRLALVVEWCCWLHVENDRLGVGSRWASGDKTPARRAVQRALEGLAAGVGPF